MDKFSGKHFLPPLHCLTLMKKAVEVPLLGHPDKICDLLVESIVDEYIRRDPF